jgi:hypothetical protein
VGLVQIERTEEKNGIVQKFYRPIAEQFHIDQILSPHVEELSDSIRESFIVLLDKTKTILKKVDDSVLTSKGGNKKGFRLIYETLDLTPDQVSELQEKYDEINELLKHYSLEDARSAAGIQRHHIIALAFPVEDYKK